MERQSNIIQQNTSDVVESPSLAEMSQWADSDLINACLKGNEVAWQTLIERHSRLIYTIPLRFGMSKALADEVFQETCLILLEKLGTLKDQQRLSAWLATVTRRACIQRLRSKPKVQLVELNEQIVSADSPLEDDLMRIEEQYQVHQALQRIDQRCQALLHAIFFEKPPRSYEEIAETLEMSVGSVGPTRARCLKKLRHELEEIEDGN